MDSYQLFCTLRYFFEYTDVKKVYVIAANEMCAVSFDTLPIIICQNDQNKNQAGSHWVCYYVYRYRSKIFAEFWDSLGKNNLHYGLEFPFPILKYNSFVLQANNSDICAHYCIYFLWKRAHGQDFEKIQSIFSSHRVSNDKIVLTFFKQFVKSLPATCIINSKNVI